MHIAPRVTASGDAAVTQYLRMTQAERKSSVRHELISLQPLREPDVFTRPEIGLTPDELLEQMHTGLIQTVPDTQHGQFAVMVNPLLNVAQLLLTGHTGQKAPRVSLLALREHFPGAFEALSSRKAELIEQLGDALDGSKNGMNKVLRYIAANVDRFNVKGTEVSLS